MDEYRYNPATEQVVVLRNGEWQPYEGRKFRSPQTGAVGVYDRGQLRIIYDPRGRQAEPVARQGQNLWAAAATGTARAIAGLPSIPTQIGNLMARRSPALYEGGRISMPGSGAYNAPLPTREEVISGVASGARGMGLGGVADVIERQPITGAERVTQGTFEAGAEGLAFGGAPRALARGAAGRLTPSQLRMAGGEAAREGGASALAGLAASATGEAFGPEAGVAAGLATGTISGRTMFSPSRGDELIRQYASNMTDSDFEAARNLMQSAMDQGIELTAAEAVAATAIGGRDLARLASDVSALRQGANRFTPIQQRRLERFGTRLDEILSEVRQGAPLPLSGPGMTAQMLQEAARSARGQARATVGAGSRPFYERIAGIEYPQENVAALDARLSAVQNQFGPNSPEYAQVENLRQGLRDSEGNLITSVNQLDNWVQSYYDRVRDTGDNRLMTQTARVAGPLVGEFNSQMLENVPQLARARREHAELSRIIVNPVDRALAGIPDPSQQADARSLFRYIAGETGTAGAPRMEVAETRRGFRAIYQQNPRVATQALSYHVRDVFNTAMQEMRDARSPTFAPAEWRRRLYGSSEKRAQIRAMFDELDRQRGIPVGSSIRAMDNFLDIAAATGQLPGVGSQTAQRSALQSQAREGRVLLGATAQTLTGGIAAPTNAIGRWMANTIEAGTYDRIAELFAQTNPDAIDNIMRLSRTDGVNPQAFVIAAQLIGARQGVEPGAESQE